MIFFIDSKKAQVFVAHIQNHLDNSESFVRGSIERNIPAGKVGCKICNLSIDRIYSQYLRRIGWMKSYYSKSLENEKETKIAVLTRHEN